MVPTLGYNRFFPNPFQFIYHPIYRRYIVQLLTVPANNNRKIKANTNRIINILLLRHYATRRKVAGLVSDEVITVFNLPNPSNRTMALGSTQPLTEMSTRNLPG
jgi:hypothetical protein